MGAFLSRLFSRNRSREYHNDPSVKFQPDEIQFEIETYYPKDERDSGHNDESYDMIVKQDSIAQPESEDGGDKGLTMLNPSTSDESTPPQDPVPTGSCCTAPTPGSPTSITLSDKEHAGDSGLSMLTPSMSDEQSPSTHENPMMSKEEKKAKGNIIEDILRSNISAIVEQVNPGVAAKWLYGYRIISHDECESATLDRTPKSDRSTALLLLLIKKLRWNPDWCEAAIVALKKGGVNMESIIMALADARIDVTSKCDFNEREETSRFYTDPPGKEVSKDSLNTNHNQIEVQPLHKHKPKVVDERTNGATCTMKPNSNISILWAMLGRTEYEIADKDGNTPLHVAASIGNLAITEKILEHIPSIINNQNNRNQTALHLSIASEHRSTLVVKRLCECKQRLNPYLLDKGKRTALHYACFSGVTDLVKPLLKLHSDSRFINATDCNGDTGLHIATRRGYMDIMNLLLKKKADKTITNDQQQTAKDIAQECGNSKAMNKLSGIFQRGQVKKMSQSSTSPTLSSLQSMDSISSQAMSSKCSSLAVDILEDESGFQDN